jgi:DNA-binding NarL/FixJ family response regulator
VPITNPIAVLVADDQSVVRAGLRVVLDAAPDIAVVGEAADGAEAAARAAELRPHVVLMDVQMPGCDGTRACAASSRPGWACGC